MTANAKKGQTIIARKPKWYAVYVMSKHEKKVADLFEEQNIKYFLPLHKILKQWSDRKKWVEEPIFKSYIFVRVALRQYEKVLFTEGVVTFVKFNGFPEPVNDDVIKNLITILKSEEEFEVTDEQFELNETVKVVRGALKGVVGQVAELHGKYKLIVHIEVLGRRLMLNVNKNQVEKLKIISKT